MMCHPLGTGQRGSWATSTLSQKSRGKRGEGCPVPQPRWWPRGSGVPGAWEALPTGRRGQIHDGQQDKCGLCGGEWHLLATRTPTSIPYYTILPSQSPAHSGGSTSRDAAWVQHGTCGPITPGVGSGLGSHNSGGHSGTDPSQKLPNHFLKLHRWASVVLVVTQFHILGHHACPNLLTQRRSLLSVQPRRLFCACSWPTPTAALASHP